MKSWQRFMLFECLQFWLLLNTFRRTRCTGESEAGTALLDVGTDEVETEFTPYDGSHWLSAENKQAASLRCDWLVAKRRRATCEMLERLNAVNVQHCDQRVIYGADLHAVVDCMSASPASSWASVGYVNCLEAQFSGPLRPRSMSVLWSQTDALKDAIHTPEHHLQHLRDVLVRYVLSSSYWCCVSLWHCVQLALTVHAGLNNMFNVRSDQLTNDNDKLKYAL